MKRYKMSRSGSRQSFTRNAMKVHKKNLLSGKAGPMRGGIRL